MRGTRELKILQPFWQICFTRTLKQIQVNANNYLKAHNWAASVWSVGSSVLTFGWTLCSAPLAIVIAIVANYKHCATVRKNFICYYTVYRLNTRTSMYDRTSHRWHARRFHRRLLFSIYKHTLWLLLQTASQLCLPHLSWVWFHGCGKLKY